MHQYHHSAKSLERDERFADAIVERMRRYEPNPFSDSWVQARFTNSPRGQVLAKIQAMRDNLPENRHIVLLRTEVVEYRLYFNEVDTRSFIMKYDSEINMVFKSCQFFSRDDAVKAFKREVYESKKMNYVDYADFSSPSPDQSPP